MTTDIIKTEKPVLYIDMDNVLVDFESGIKQLPERLLTKYHGKLDEVPHIFSLMKPMENAIEVIKKLHQSNKYDMFILSTSPWLNPQGLKDKLEWIHRYFGKDEKSIFYKRIIFSHHKNLNKGFAIIDDRLKNGVDKFEGKLIHFGTESCPDWEAVEKILL